MFAVIESGGKQIKAVPGQCIDIEKLPQNKGEKVLFDNVLMLVTGKDSKIGNPYIKGASVKGHLVEQAKDDKVIVYKMRPKKGTRKKQGHRQLFTRVQIQSIELDGKAVATAEEIQPKKVKAKKNWNPTGPICATLSAMKSVNTFTRKPNADLWFCRW